MICWLDVKTTGLDPDTNEILELGMIITSDDLRVLNQLALVINPGSFYMDVMVFEMHSKSGLLEDIQQGMRAREAADRLILAMSAFTGDELSSMRVGGKNVARNREFLRKTFPDIEDMLGPKNLDIGIIQDAMLLWCDISPLFPNKTVIPRVKPYLDNVIEEARELRRLFEGAQ